MTQKPAPCQRAHPVWTPEPLVSPVVLIGPPELGKPHLAAEDIRSRREVYDRLGLVVAGSDAQAAHLSALVDDLGLERAVVQRGSLGRGRQLAALVEAMLSRQHPRRVLLILDDLPPDQAASAHAAWSAAVLRKIGRLLGQRQ